jgi:hypothetical protein
VARDHDRQLLESVSVRRRRLRDAVLFGTGSTRRTFHDQLARAVTGVVLAAVAAAGCVGWAYLQHRLIPQQNQPAVPSSSATR